MDEFDVLLAALLLMLALAAVLVGYLLRGDIRVEAREDDKPYIRVKWRED